MATTSTTSTSTTSTRTTSASTTSASPAIVKVLVLAVVDACRESTAASQLAGQALASATKATQEALDAILDGVVEDPRKPDPTKAKACYKALDEALQAAGLPDSTACRRTEQQEAAPDEARAAARIAAALSQRLSRVTRATIKAACDDGHKAVRSGNMTPERAEQVLLKHLQGIQMTDADKAALHDACRAGAGLQASPVAVAPVEPWFDTVYLWNKCKELADTLPPREALTEVMRLLENALAPTTNLPVTPTPTETKTRARTRRRLKAA